MSTAHKPKRQSRSARWADAASIAADALQALKDVQEEFESWRDNLPENLAGSALGEKLEAVCDLDIEGALGIAQEAVDIELPLGFGRD